MSTPEIIMLLRLLPLALQEHPEWFVGEDREAALRLLTEMSGGNGKQMYALKLPPK